MKLPSEDCPNFEWCDAPLCPLDEISLREGIWYPDEPICPRRFKLAWLKVQRKISRLPNIDTDRYFNLEMLTRNCVISRGIKGLDPDREEGPQLKRWLKAHPPKRELTDEERKKLSDRLLKTPIHPLRKQKKGAQTGALKGVEEQTGINIPPKEINP